MSFDAVLVEVMLNACLSDLDFNQRQHSGKGTLLLKPFALTVMSQRTC